MSKPKKARKGRKQQVGKRPTKRLRKKLKSLAETCRSLSFGGPALVAWLSSNLPPAAIEGFSPNQLFAAKVSVIILIFIAFRLAASYIDDLRG